MKPEELRLRMEGISKSFPGVQALKNARLELRPGEVHALVGENGAGKSTLVKIMTGIYPDFGGSYEYLGKPVDFRSISDAQQAGISIVHQELNMMSDLTVAQNIFIGRESSSFRISDRDLNRRAQALIDEFEIGVDPRALLRDLSVGKAQMVEIARAMSFTETKVLILDEPSAALSEGETIELLAKIDQMRANGVSVVYISHRMNEIMQITDRVTVLRDGEYIDTLETASCTVDEIIERMVGRRVTNLQKERSEVPVDAEVVLRAEHLSSASVNDVSFELRKGEILGFAGLIGAGRTETMQILCGADPWGTGTVEVHGKPLHFSHPKEAIEAGIAYLSEDRKRYGLVLGLSVTDNTVLPSYDALSTGLVVREAECRKATQHYVDAMRIKTPSVGQIVKNLSGGNQQKVVLAKWLLRDVEILIFDEPTRGIDIGARSEIYEMMRGLTAQGKSIILVSSDLNEILHLCDRIVVMCEGQATGELAIAEATQVKIMELATQHQAKEQS
ncbi:sugar ABC transporter ATP-binding protein [Brooklawnia sp.]|uniref:sugar ABC transporter ATP-binding protein n=1 Tax=Brooklawnia sp. TaxID=2699740 RepID=UPI00311D9CBB